MNIHSENLNEYCDAETHAEKLVFRLHPNPHSVPNPALKISELNVPDSADSIEFRCKSENEHPENPGCILRIEVTSPESMRSVVLLEIQPHSERTVNLPLIPSTTQLGESSLLAVQLSIESLKEDSHEYAGLALYIEFPGADTSELGMVGTDASMEPRYEVGKHLSSSLTALANKFGSDKGTLNGNAHHYSLVYDELFFPLKDRPINLLEIGLAIGGPECGGPVDRHVDSPSVRMWLEYFSQAHIFGFDISEFGHIDSDRFTFTRGDAGDPGAYEGLISSGTEFDIILDDGSHASFHQQLSLKMLFDRLKPGGLYIIEDLNWQPTHIEIELPKVLPTALLLSEVLVHGRVVSDGIFDEPFCEKLQSAVSSVALLPNLGGPDKGGSKLAILRKALPNSPSNAS